ncbi:MAG: ATP-binding cassette domain-containing protein [Lachnospira sp.]|nr:ATP-binding cassette domain-containing protein [Lachnospira sp.]
MYLEITNLNKEIGKTMILQNINMQMEQGEIYGLMGINGSGKTMIMRCMCGLVRPTNGSVKINGKELGKDIDFPQSLGALIENPGFIEHYSAIDNMKALASIRKKAGELEIKELLQRVGLDDKDKKKVKKYSLGMRQKLGIAMALLEDPDMIILDEPFNALDEKSVEIVKQIILDAKKRNKLIIISCHNKDDLNQLSDEIYKIENGHIIDHYEKI